MFNKQKTTHIQSFTSGSVHCVCVLVTQQFLFGDNSWLMSWGLDGPWNSYMLVTNKNWTNVKQRKPRGVELLSTHSSPEPLLLLLGTLSSFVLSWWVLSFYFILSTVQMSYYPNHYMFINIFPQSVFNHTCFFCLILNLVTQLSGTITFRVPVLASIIYNWVTLSV